MRAHFLHSSGRDGRILDAGVLVAVVALSALPYVTRLGFYSDDWNLLAGFESAARSGQSVIAATLPDYGVRPVQGIYLAALYESFGLHPLGYHVVNTAVIAASVALLYVLLLRLRFTRAEAFAAALVFALMPQLSTVRVWFAAFQIPLSMLLALIAMHALLLFERSERAHWVSLGVAVFATGLSLAAYEIFAPLIAGFAAAVLFLQLRKQKGGRIFTGRVLASLAVLATVVVTVGLKFFTERSSELAEPDEYWQRIRVFLSPHYDWRTDYGLNVFAGLDVHFWRTLRDWASAVVPLTTGQAGLTVVATAVGIGALAWWRLSSMQESEAPLGRWRLLLFGLGAFILGHATFLVATSIMFAPTGIGNRVLVAGTVGTAIIIVAVIMLVVRSASPRLRHTLFASIVAVIAMAAVARLEFVEEYWAETPKLERRVIEAARSDLARLPAGSTVILDGVCPYHGPAIVFETDWDIEGALTLAIGRQIAGDTVSPRMKLTSTALESEIYGEPKHYGFGPRLFVYNPWDHRLVRLAYAEAARRYFSSPSRRPMRCPIGYVGHGVLV